MSGKELDNTFISFEHDEQDFDNGSTTWSLSTYI